MLSTELEGVKRATEAARIIVRDVKCPDERLAALEAHSVAIGRNWKPSAIKGALKAADCPARDQATIRLERVAKDA